MTLGNDAYIKPCLSVCPSVCRKPVLYRNGWTDRSVSA